MSAQVISSAYSTLNVPSKPNHSSTTTLPNYMSSISFSFQVTKSKIFLKPPPGLCRTRSSTRIQALYIPSEFRETLYELLGITDPENATLSDIKKAYKRMARKYHPDVAPPDKVNEYTKLFIKVHEAYELLSDPNKRALYDKGLAARFDKKPDEYDQKTVEQRQWRMRWQVQLEELKRRSEARSKERSRRHNNNA